MKESFVEVRYCPVCGSSNTCSLAWVNNKTGEIEEYVGSFRDEENNFCNNCNEHVALRNIKELWEMFSDIMVNEDDEIETEFLGFPAGTDKMEIWHWFDEGCPNGLAIDLMGETSKY